jgi:uncharacterized membrane protein
MNASNFFTEEEKKALELQIFNAEQNTSGEIRIHLEQSCKEDVLDRAVSVFESLNMHETKLRNGVLFYVAIDDHKFAILGDAGINEKVPANFWNAVKEEVLDHFKGGNYFIGLDKGVKMAGEKLKTYFPVSDQNPNELSDEITFS